MTLTAATAVRLLAAGALDNGGGRPGVGRRANSARVQPTQDLAVLHNAQQLRSAPGGPTSRAVATVAAWAPITGIQTTLPVLGHATTAGGVRWLRVMVPGRPNGTTGWIAKRGTTASSTSWRLVVRTASRRVRVYRRGRLVRTIAVAVGKPSTPTPHGRFFVEESILMPRGSAGAPYALALSARSNVLQEWAGGPGQIAIHGVGEPRRHPRDRGLAWLRAPARRGHPLAGDADRAGRAGEHHLLIKHTKSRRRPTYHGGMAVLIASDLSKDMAGNPLLRGVSFKLERRDRLTIAGRNGAGKTTLLRMLAGETSVDGGDLSFQKGCKVSLHDQRPPRDRDLTLRDYILGGCADLIAAEQDLSRLAQAMADGDESAFAAYSRAEARLEHAGGWTWRDRATAMVRGLGFDDDDLDRSLKTFSGGELTRASLARALAGDPDLLLLDEPTNHLDIESLEWLEKTLTSLDTAIVLVAHDRWFLEAVGTAVLELEAGRSRFFPGTWTAWRKELAAREIALGRAIDKQQAEIARLERFVERFRAKATKAKQAQSRVKQLDKIERIERDPRDREALKFQFKAPERSGRVVFELTGGRVEVGADPPRVLLDDAEIWLERGEHVSLVGPNGAGKTTLIDTLAGVRAARGGQALDGPQREDRPPLAARRRAQPRVRGAAPAPSPRRPRSTPG